MTSWSLPIAMGVEVTEAQSPVAGLAGLAAVDAPVWPGGDVGAAPGGYRISHAADSALTAVNRLLKEGKKVFWLRRPADGGRGRATSTSRPAS